MRNESSTQCFGRLILVIFLLLAAGILQAGADDTRVALVIGNGAYQAATVSPLANPPNDARDVSEKLRQIGFDVTTVIDGSREEIGVAVGRFGEALQRADVGIFYYAGHGVQVDGVNYLIPVDADLPSANLVQFRAVSTDEILAYMEAAGTGLNMFFLDACRDNPLPQASRSMNRGLAAANRRPPETMIVYATAAGTTAADGSGRNSPFTRAFLNNIGTPGQDVYDLYRTISAEVRDATGGDQRPEQYGNVTVRYALVPGTAQTSGQPARRQATQSTGQATSSTDAAQSAPAGPRFPADGAARPAVQGPVLSIAPGTIEVTVATSADLYLSDTFVTGVNAGGTTTLAEIAPGEQTVVARYPDGNTEEVAITAVSGRTVSASFTYIPPAYGSLLVSVATDGMLFMDGRLLGPVISDQVIRIDGVLAGVRDLEMRYDNARTETLHPDVTADQVSDVSFVYIPRPYSEETWGIVGIPVPGGTFQMGSSTGGDNERPVHRTVVDSFTMMETEVTFAQYTAFAQATGREIPGDDRFGRGNRPVIHVRWNDTAWYANWLSEQDGLTPVYEFEGTRTIWNREANGWRLPTEAEWEYAARGGRDGWRTVYAGQNLASPVAWYDQNADGRTHPVALKQENKLGLHDMSGNVSEWCWDWYRSGYYAESPEENPAGPDAGAGRVARGGNFGAGDWSLRVSSREFYAVGYDGGHIGFRLVRSGDLP